MAALIHAGRMARLLDLTHESLRQLAADGWFPKAVNGQHPPAPMVQGYIRFLQDDNRRNARSRPDAESQARSTFGLPSASRT